MIEHKKPNFEDQRGIIRDIFVNSPKDHCAVITFNDGVIRGNHFHKKSTQYTYIVRGNLQMSVQKVDDAGDATGEIEVSHLKEGDLAIHPPFEAHAFRSSGESIILAFADGVRGGDDYEKDVFRLKSPIQN